MPEVIAVAFSPTYTFSKPKSDAINLLKGLGVENDVHSGKTVKHRSRIKKDPTQPNLRQVHLMHAELFDELREKGLTVAPGEMGENITTRGIDLLGLSRGTRLHFPSGAIVEITGLRNPCVQLDNFQPGLLAAVLDHGPNGELIRKAGVMGVVIEGGTVRTNDAIEVEAFSGAHFALKPV